VVVWVTAALVVLYLARMDSYPLYLGDTSSLAEENLEVTTLLVSALTGSSFFSS